MSWNRRNIAAYTSTGPNYPAYISVNETESGQVEVTVRGPAVEEGDGHGGRLFMNAGATAAIVLSREVVESIQEALSKYLQE